MADGRRGARFLPVWKESSSSSSSANYCEKKERES